MARCGSCVEESSQAWHRTVIVSDRLSNWNNNSPPLTTCVSCTLIWFEHLAMDWMFESLVGKFFAQVISSVRQWLQTKDCQVTLIIVCCVFPQYYEHTSLLHLLYVLGQLFRNREMP